MSAVNALLESFDDAGVEFGFSGDDPRTQQIKAAAFAEGYAAAEANLATRQNEDMKFFKQLEQVINAAASDLPARMDAQLCEGLAAIFKAVFPNLAGKGFAVEVAAAIAADARFAATPELQLEVEPTRVDAVREALSAEGLEDTVMVTGNAKLTKLGARAQWGDAGVDFDADKASAKAIEILEGLARTLKTGK